MKHHLVIVEDDRVSRMRLGAYLRQLGYRVTEVENAEEMEHILSFDLLIVTEN